MNRRTLKVINSMVSVLALLFGLSGYAVADWEHRSSGDDTAFEQRWVMTDAIASLSSNEKLASDMLMGAADDEAFYVWVEHPRPAICKFSNWKLAVDKTVISVKSELGDSENATALLPVDKDASDQLRRLFRDGDKIAVNVRAECDNMFYLRMKNTVTMTYSLDGSGAALRFLTGGAPEINKSEERHSAAPNSDEMAAYQFALQQKVLRNWARPADAQAGLDCTVQVRQSATGEVISARIVSCNGDAAVERSIEAAVYKASPLPLPENRLLFDPNLRFRFIPEQ